MELAVVFHSILLIAILIILGAIVARSYKFNSDTNQMFITLITNVAMPSIILSSIFKVDIKNDMLQTLAVIFLISISINLVGLGLGYVISLIFKQNSKKIEIAVLSAFGNTGFIGIPLCAVFFGPEGALYAAVFDAGVDFTIWTVGVYIIQQNKRFSWQTLKGMINIPLIAIVVGLIVAILGLQSPDIIIDTVDSLSSFAVPLAMFYIGAIMSNFQGTKINASYAEVIIPVAIKLIILPIIVISVVLATHFDELTIYIVIIQSMMPALTLSSVLFAKYARNEKFGALVTILSTLFSLLTIPGILYLVESIS